MTRVSIISLIAVALLCAGMPVNLVAAPTEQEALGDWKALVDLYDKAQKPLGDFRSGYVSTDFESMLDKYQKVDAAIGADIKKTLESFGVKYGKTATAIDNTLRKIVKRPTTMRAAGYTYETLKEMYDAFAGVRTKTAEILLKEVDQQLGIMTHFDESIRQERYAEVKKKLEIAAQYDPTNAAIKEKLGSIDTVAKEAAAAVEKQRDERKWPGNFKGFAGPGSPAKLIREAEKFLRTDEGWSKGKLIAVCIKGNWWAVEKNILDQPTVWGLPVFAAFEDKKDPKNVKVFSLSMCTLANAKQAPPFVGATVGDNFTMRRANVKGGGGGGLIGGFFGFWAWLALIAANIVAGLLAAAPLLTVKVPQLHAVYVKLTPFRNVLGVVVLAIGVLMFLGSLLTFSPLSNLLPQLSAIAAGLFLGKELLLKKPTHEPATSAAGQKAQSTAMKAQEMFAHHQDKIAMLEKFQVPIGIACIVLGLLHLVMGGVVLL